MKGDRNGADITLYLSTFVVRYLLETRAMTEELVEIIAEVQDEINFSELVVFMIRERLTNELFTLILNSKLSARTRDQIA